MNESSYYSEVSETSSIFQDFLFNTSKYNIDDLISESSEEDWKERRKEDIY